MVKQHEMDLTYTYQTTSIGLDIRSEDVLESLLSSLQDDNCAVVFLHDRKRRITLHIYLRFRERPR